VKALVENLKLTPAQAKGVRAFLRDGESAYMVDPKYRNRTWSDEDRARVVLESANEYLDKNVPYTTMLVNGVEVIHQHPSDFSNCRGDGGIWIAYINTGETYQNTLCICSTGPETVYIGSWGGTVEGLELRGRKFE
jgi:hypothetical protein